MTEIVEYVDECGGCYFRSVFLAFAGTMVPQHIHEEDHATLVGHGKARLYVDGRFEQDIPAGKAVLIKAGRAHLFEALEDNTRLTCVWSLEAAAKLKEKGF